MCGVLGRAGGAGGDAVQALVLQGKDVRHTGVHACDAQLLRRSANNAAGAPCGHWFCRGRE
jgi:hypothetical protein